MCRDHPRVGGEKSPASVPRVYGPGSPPRGRGKVDGVEGVGRAVRITPAWAGKRAARGESSSSSWDHPRMGGEKASEYTRPLISLGSPPRRRGKALLSRLPCVLYRITPAWAGKRSSPSAIVSPFRDHPRVGGEKSTGLDATSETIGSPPRRRGKAQGAASHPRRRWITPAWAGKSPASQPWSPPLWMMVIRPRP